MLTSVVPGFEGNCKPVWLNRNQIYIRQSGGVTGFFRLTKKLAWLPITIKTGKEFHGIIRGGVVYSTEGLGSC